MHKKGQAAVEFLLTYGWAIMMIMVIVGAFAYLGFTNPQQFIANKCVLTSGFDCTEVGWINDTTTGVTYAVIFLTNLQENDITIPADGEFTGDCEPITNFEPLLGEQTAPEEYTMTPSGVNIERKTKHLIAFECPDVTRAQKYRLTFSIPYRELRTEFTKSIEGEITLQGTSQFPQYTLN